MYFISTILHTGYLKDTQLYFTEVLDSPPIDAWNELLSWQVWYTGHGSEPLNGWWDVSGASEPVPLFIKDGTAVHSLSLSTCKNLIGTITTGTTRNLSLDGKTATVTSPYDSPLTITWSDGSVWTKRPHKTKDELLHQLVGGIGSVFLTNGQQLENWFIPKVWNTVDETLYKDFDGNRNSVTAYTPAVFDATLAIAKAVDSLVKTGQDYTNGPLLYNTIKGSTFQGLSGSVGFDQYGDRANATYILFNYDTATTKQTIATVSGDTLTMSTINVVKYNQGSLQPLADGTCLITDPLTGSMCNGQGTCKYGLGTCECNLLHLGTNCEIPIPEACTLDNVELSVGTCNSDNKRVVISRFISDCCDASRFPGVPTRCDTGISLPLAVTVECDYVHIDSDVSMAMLTIGALAIALMLVFIVIISIYRARPEIVMGQPPFLILCCLGGIIGITSMCIYPGDWTTLRCRILATLPSIGFTVMTTSVVLKAWRVDAIFNNKSLYMINIGPLEMIKRFAIILGIDVLLLLLFILVNNVHASTHFETTDGKLVDYTTCTADAFYFGYILLLFKFVLMLYGVMLALRVRSSKTDFSESKYIVYAIYNTAAVAIIGVYLYIFADLDVEPTYQAFGVCTFLVFTITPFIIVLPRLFDSMTTKRKVSPDNDYTSQVSVLTTRAGFNLTTAGNMSDLETKGNEQLYEMLAEQQEEIRQLKVLIASKG